jgi:hypothetical protein
VQGLHKRTKSPTSKALCFTFVSLHDFVFVWYFCRLATTLSLSDSNKSLSSASMRQGEASGIVRELMCLISSGITASSPNNSRNGEKFVALETIVL